MKILGIDIGTTTVSAVVMEGGRMLDSRTVESDSFVLGGAAWERVQDVGRICRIAGGLADEFISVFPDLAAIGFTGQQHGIVYVDKSGRAVSNLVTWQDGRGGLPYENGLTYAEYVRRVSGYEVAPGYGLVSHFYNVRNGLVPDGAVSFCTIQDYIAMSVCGLGKPAVDPSDAASFGLFDVRSSRFDLEAVSALGMDCSFLPEPAAGPIIGKYRNLPVAVAIGDNQACFLAAAGPGKMLVNIGTGSQFSAHSDEYMQCDGLETRPFPTGGYLLVGAALCGGRSFALLDNFFRETLFRATGVRPDHCYQLMEDMAASVDGNVPLVEPLFCGTRRDPSLRASIRNLDADNFTPGHLVRGVLQGIADELYGMFLIYRKSGGRVGALCGSGNGIVCNPRMRSILEDTFGMPLTLSDCREEAACGAAMFAENILKNI